MLDLILRGGAIGTITATALVLVVGKRGSGPASVACFGALITCYLVISAPAATGLPERVRPILIGGATLAPLALTWMMMELLTDRSRPRWPWSLLAGLSVLAAVAGLIWGEAIPVRGVLIILLYLGLIAATILSDRGDLVVSRRRFRRGFLVVMGVLGVVISVIETLGLDRDLPGWVFPLQAGTFWFLAAVFAVWALRPDAALFLPDQPTRPASRPSSRPELVNRLNAAMEGGLWQREGLTIGALAKELGVPEHRLRVTINRELGYRNFSTFINGHRIEAARAMLQDPARADTTILEIAFECGFSSLGPFNKAFRAQTGTNPREYRSQHG